MCVMLLLSLKKNVGRFDTLLKLKGFLCKISLVFIGNQTMIVWKESLIRFLKC